MTTSSNDLDQDLVNKTFETVNVVALISRGFHCIGTDFFLVDVVEQKRTITVRLCLIGINRFPFIDFSLLCSIGKDVID